MKIVFFGTSGFGIPSLEALGASHHSLSLIVTTSDKPKGRDLKSEASIVKTWAKDHKLPCLETAEAKSAGFIEKVRQVQADIFVVISFGLILPKALLEAPKLMALNVHSSLLPRYRGAAPMHWALIHGDPETGVTVMRMTEKLDAGDIALQKKIKISPEDDIFSVEERLSRAGASALLEVLGQIEKNAAQFIPQDEAHASYARKLTKEDGQIHWKSPAREIQNRVRAMRQWPTSYTFCGGKRLIIEQIAVDDSHRLAATAPGCVLEASRDKGIRVASSDFPVEIKSLKLEGRKTLAAKDFLNGFPLKAGQLFE